MRFNIVNFPIVEWIKKGNPFDYCLTEERIVTPDRITSYKHIYDRYFKGQDIKLDYVTQTILDITDYSEKNVSVFKKMHTTPTNACGVMMFGREYSILYKITSNKEEFPVEFDSSQEGLDQLGLSAIKFITTFAFAGRKLVRVFSGLLIGQDNEDIFLFYKNLSWAMPSGVIGGHLSDDYCLAEDFNLFKRFADVETRVVRKHQAEDFINCKYHNNLNSNINIYDSTYFTTLINSEGFNVRGHFRWQACGEGLKDRKLIWVNDFQKEGYTRIAKKLKE